MSRTQASSPLNERPTKVTTPSSSSTPKAATAAKRALAPSAAKTCSSGAAPGSVLIDALTGDRYTVSGGGQLNIAVDAFDAVILVPEADYQETP